MPFKMVAALALLAAVTPAEGGNLLRNPSFETLQDGRPTFWEAADWGTGGKSVVGTEGERRYALLSGTSEQQRAGWRQRVPFQGPVVVFEGKMRTRGVAAGASRGASVRLAFRDENAEISLSQAFFPPADTWTRVRRVFLVPEGTRTIWVELLHWFAAGETHWDDVSLKGGSERDMTEFARQNLDQPPKENQKPYHPTDGQRVEVSPPPFIWVPAGTGLTYTLQISTSRSFAPAQTRTYGGLRRSVFVPGEVLPPGRWYWRYGVQAAGGAVYGRARPFTIPPEARPFPFPNFAEVVQRVPRTRPRLFFPGEQLARVRAAAQGELKDVVDSLVRACERAVGEELVAEPGYRPKEPEKQGPWAVQVMRTTRPPMDIMERCALAYLITGNRRLGEEARRRILHFFSWDPEGPTSFFAYDEPPMWMMMRGTRAYDWTYDLFTPEERSRVEANMKQRAQQFLRRLQSMPFESSPYESHAGRLPGFLGECALSFIHEWPEARNWREYATLLYATSYPAWGGDDGGWQEGPSYWSAYMDFALHFVVALRAATGVDLT
ncbi:MAG: DUF4962 domain-containing protein, partial [Armatimonadota bacterium]|nr:DUF4962 domain-containing protein [Armatimonadota bacterium]